MRYRLTVKGKVVFSAVTIFAALISYTIVQSELVNYKPREVINTPITVPEKVNPDKPVSSPTDTVRSDVHKDQEKDYDIMRSLRGEVLFLPNQWENPTGFEALDGILKYALKYPNVKLAVVGNINGYPDFNIDNFGRQLSQKRAQVVAQYLMVKGISKERITIENGLNGKPAVEMRDSSNYWKNRRTEVYFILD